MATKETAIQTLIGPTISAMGFELWGISHISQGRNSRLVIYIDSDKGVTVDDCADISRQVSALLDVEDPISGHYDLEVSSPGMDRPLYTLSHYERYAGHQIQLRLRVPFEGRRKFQGLLAGVEQDEVLLHVDGEEYAFPIEGIERANVMPTFENKR
ncbi:MULTISPECIES: ribosome maturation factor RimP [Zymobacter]|uniref:Ribosome maturation factor RimP n=1 Tax=Zymobacter palmae TaxID=33074 RepID=A0A348HBQ5_9GAMM|nr:ribosome maturation factor RimP [Zymobacter palmae]BBG29057.1 uncharacterized protein conserved in bacteria [Zymobacter palmae]